MNASQAKLHTLKQKILNNPTHHLDLIYDLLPENRLQAEMIMHLLDELVKEKKLNRFTLWKHMETPLYFRENDYHDFSRRGPLIGKIVRDGGLALFNHYLVFKYGVSLCPNLLSKHDIFIFTMPTVKCYFDKNKNIIPTSKEERIAIENKYYDVYGRSYELFGDVLQEKSLEILKRLADCGFDFNSKSSLEHLNQYFYINRYNRINVSDANLQFLLDHGLNSENYLNMIIMNLWDEFSLPTFANASSALIHMSTFLIDHGAELKQVSAGFLTEMDHLLEQHAKRLGTTYQKQFYQQTLMDIRHLQIQLRTLSAAKQSVL